MRFDSKNEARAAEVFATMPIPAYPSKSFADAGMPETYPDPSGALCIGKPDFLVTQPRGVTFIESKDCDLNTYYTQEESRFHLEQAYWDCFRVSGYGKSHSFLSGELHNRGGQRGKLLALSIAYNHSLWKLRSLQAEHGWMKYMVVFKKTPPKRRAKAYIEAGLIFCTEKTLPEMLEVIEFARHGIFVTFTFFSARAKYGYTVTPDHRDMYKSAEDVKASERSKLLASVASNQARRGLSEANRLH